MGAVLLGGCSAGHRSEKRNAPRAALCKEVPPFSLSEAAEAHMISASGIVSLGFILHLHLKGFPSILILSFLTGVIGVELLPAHSAARF